MLFFRWQLWSHLKVPLGWTSKMSFSLTCLMPSSLTWLKKLGAAQASLSISMYPLHMASLAFFAAWESQSSRISYMVTGFSRASIPRGPGRSCKASCTLSKKPQSVSPYHCIPLVKVTNVCPRFKGKDVRLPDRSFIYFKIMFSKDIFRSQSSSGTA